jgi:hypothetical protein
MEWYGRLHDRVTMAVADILEADNPSEEWIARRVDTLKNHWTDRISAYKQDLRVRKII